MGTSLIRKPPPLGTFGWPVPRMEVLGRRAFLMSEVPLHLQADGGDALADAGDWFLATGVPRSYETMPP